MRMLPELENEYLPFNNILSTRTTAYSIEFPSMTPTRSPLRTPTDSSPRASALLLVSSEA
jgi:hypothetical protein